MKPNRYLLTMLWGLGDVLCTTPAMRALRAAEPDAEIIFQTYVKGRRPLEYDHPRGAGAGGAPDEMLWDNPDVHQIIDPKDPRPGGVLKAVTFEYVRVGAPSLDVPLQAGYFDNLGLPWDASTRFDAHYYPRDEELGAAAELLCRGTSPHEQFCVLMPRCGWAGKNWATEGWADLIYLLLRHGWMPVILNGRRLTGPPWDRGLNLSGTLDIRQTAAVLAKAQAMVTVEGGMTHLRFALGKPAVVLTCATRYGLQVWAPPELLTEVRNADDCDPCMWRREHIRGKTDTYPGNIRECPKGRSLRDLTGEDVWPAVEKHLEEVSRGDQARSGCQGHAH